MVYCCVYLLLLVIYTQVLIVIKKIIVVVMMECVDLGLNITSTHPFKIMEKVLMVIG